MTDAEIILILQTALESADRKLELILGEPPPRRDEYAATVALGVRRVIQNGLNRAFGKKPMPVHAIDDGGAKRFPKERPALQRATFKAWQLDNIIKKGK